MQYFLRAFNHVWYKASETERQILLFTATSLSLCLCTVVLFATVYRDYEPDIGAVYVFHNGTTLVDRKPLGYNAKRFDKNTSVKLTLVGPVSGVLWHVSLEISIAAPMAKDLVLRHGLTSDALCQLLVDELRSALVVADAPAGPDRSRVLQWMTPIIVGKYGLILDNLSITK